MLCLMTTLYHSTPYLPPLFDVGGRLDYRRALVVVGEQLKGSGTTPRVYILFYKSESQLRTKERKRKETKEGVQSKSLSVAHEGHCV